MFTVRIQEHQKFQQKATLLSVLNKESIIDESVSYNWRKFLVSQKLNNERCYYNSRRKSFKKVIFIRICSFL